VPIGTMTVPIHWASVPSYTHFCLLARWESAEDPMFPEGPSTSANTQNNNNIAWHNVNAVLAKLKIPVVRPILFGNDGPGPDPIISDLVFTQPKPIVGRLLVDLGPDLAARWRAAGQKGTGVRQVGDTQLEIVNPQQARISGILDRPGFRGDLIVCLTLPEAARVRRASSPARTPAVGGARTTSATCRYYTRKPIPRWPG